MEFDNPFKQLDKKNFRDTKNPKKINTAKSIQKQNIQKNQASKANNLNSNDDWLTPDLESENNLFLQSMGNSTRVFKKDLHEEKLSKKSKSKLNQQNNKKTTQQQQNEDTIIEPMLQSSLKNSITIKNNTIKNENSSSNTEEKSINNVKETVNEMDFFTAMQDVKPLAGKERITPPEPEQIIHQNDRSHLIYDFEEGKLDFALTYTEDLVQCNIMGLDLLILAQLQQRHYNPEAHLDLHGLNVYQAYHTLLGFFKNAYYRDMRCVLLVTGKGLNSHDRVAILRSKVAHWLIDSPFKNIILAFCSAQNQDGGNGALYVLLRKRKKNAKPINWEQMPNDYDLWADLDK